MARFYGNKIKHQAINVATGMAWTIDDVPAKWKTATEKWLKEN